MTIKFAQIIVDNKSSKVDKPFTYILDGEFKSWVKPGMRVVVPFGRGNKPIKGIVIDVLDSFNSSYKLKKVIDVLDEKPLISKELIELSSWIKDEYLSTHRDSLRLILPPGDFKEINTFVELIDFQANEEMDKDEYKVLIYLRKRGKVLLDKLKMDLKIANISKILNELEKQKIINIEIDIKTSIEKKYERWIKLKKTNKGLEELYEIVGNRAKKQRKIIEFIYYKEDISFKEVSETLNTTLDTVRAVEDKGLIKIYDKPVNRDPIKSHIEEYKKHKLSKKQEIIFKEISSCFFQKDKKNKFLIRGITGSGKTEIYLQLVEEMIKQEKQSIVLVPEISLTPQTIDRFVGRFGELVAVFHSKLSYGERFDEWRKIKEGKVKVVVGARSAIFAPFTNLGLIIIDEEHETSYKSSQNPKYNTIEVASKRVDIENAVLVLGSATPSLESYHNSLNGNYGLLELDERVNNYLLPEVDVVDMRDELNNGNKSMFSQTLEDSIRKNLEKGRQTILFLNRRGFSTFVSCRKCGYVVKCDSCDISMTYHKHINKLRCHYCGLTVNPPSICPVCKSKYIKYFGVGTEQVEDYTRELFPQARIARMDMDTTSKKGSYERILNRMKNEEIDILVGTQMISKGLDFKNVTLVGVIAADVALNLPDFRSAERTFQLITQVAGRAGRGELSGDVIVQTYDPSHYSIELSKSHDYKGFYESEISLRKEFMYPPFYEMISIVISGEENIKIEEVSYKIYKLLLDNSFWINESNKRNLIIGPYPAPLEKIKKNYRWQIILKSKKEDMNSFKNLLKRVLIDNEFNLKIKNVKISIDINPNSIL